MRGEKLGVVAREVPRTQAVAAAALAELLRGPAGATGLVSAVPNGTRLISLAVQDGVAAVDLGEPENTGDPALDDRARAQITYTLTQFPVIEQVAIDGGPPAARADYEQQTPQILLETPTPGAEIRSPLRIEGTANTFEAMFTVKLLDGDGRTLAQKPVMATSGSGTRGTFDEQLEFTVEKPTPVRLVVYEPNASSNENGTPDELHRVEIAVTLVP